MYILPQAAILDNPYSCRIHRASAIIGRGFNHGLPMRNIHTFLLSFAFLTGEVSPCQAASPAEQRTALDEVTVNGERVKIETLRKQIVQLEDQFYDRYNELNTIDDFDVHCIEEARTGTRLIKRSCRAVYQERAIADEGQAAFKILQRLRDKPPIADSGPPVPASLVIGRRLPEYKKNIEEVTLRNPELAKLLEERGRLIERYNAALKKNWGSAGETP
jgi:hypothetical protein